MESKLTLKEKVSLLTEIFTDKNYDLDKHWETHGCGPEDIFNECCKVGNPENGKSFCQCGSIRPDDTTKGLYRLLYLLKPESVDFSDMYKTHLFTFGSVDRCFWVAVELYKYELGLYFYAPQEMIDNQNRGIIAGWPGANNNWRISNEDGKAFFNMISKAVNYTFMVYPGNNFEV